jgi:hypothetical protein
MGSKLRVIATLYSNTLHTEKLKTRDGEPIDSGFRMFADFFLQHRQFGVGVKGGLEAMCHAMRLLTELYPDKVLVKVDIKNAFNSFLRQCGIDVLSDEFPDVCRLVMNFYAKHTYTNFRDAEQELLKIMLEAGSSQGDIYGGLLFAAAYSTALNKTIEFFPDLELFAYYDDT